MYLILSDVMSLVVICLPGNMHQTVGDSTVLMQKIQSGDETPGASVFNAWRQITNELGVGTYRNQPDILSAGTCMRQA